MSESLLNITLLTLLALVAIGVVRTRNLFGVAILFAVYSFLLASVMMVLDAVDVAMTEASVGAGVSTVLILSTLYLTKTHESLPKRRNHIALLFSVAVGAMLIFGTFDLPPFGAASQPMNQHVGIDFIDRAIPETGIPNVVTAVLASYRGFDTLGEVTVVFTAGIGILMLLKRRRPKPKGGKG